MALAPRLATCKGLVQVLKHDSGRQCSRLKVGPEQKNRLWVSRLSASRFSAFCFLVFQLADCAWQACLLPDARVAWGNVCHVSQMAWQACGNAAQGRALLLPQSANQAWRQQAASGHASCATCAKQRPMTVRHWPLFFDSGQLSAVNVSIPPCLRVDRPWAIAGEPAAPARWWWQTPCRQGRRAAAHRWAGIRPRASRSG